MGKRMRPHTLTVPKPLVPVAGKPIVHWLIEDIVDVCKDEIENIAFIIGDFGAEAEKNLLAIAESVGAKGHICYQREALGTAHAINCAKELLNGEVIVAFADTLFKAQFDLNKTVDGVVWVHRVPDPSAFGVVTLDANGVINQFVEKPKDFVSDMAIIGIYYFKQGEVLDAEIQYLLDNNVTEKGEYQLTNALENMKAKGMQFATGEVEEWWDCGNKNATVHTNQRVLETKKDKLVSSRSMHTNSTIIEPCYIAQGAIISNATVGPHVSIGANSKIENCTISNSIIQEASVLKNMKFTNSMIGNNVYLDGEKHELSIGDYSTQQ